MHHNLSQGRHLQSLYVNWQLSVLSGDCSPAICPNSYDTQIHWDIGMQTRKNLCGKLSLRKAEVINQ